MRTLPSTLLVPLAMALTVSAAFAQAQRDTKSREAHWKATRDELPRWPDSGVVPDDPHQSLVPYPLRLDEARDQPALWLSGAISSPPEYDPVDGVIFRYGAGWNDVVTDCVVALTGDPAHDEKAYVMVHTAGAQANAIAQFTNGGADLSKVVFILETGDSIWARDYGPHFIWQDGAQAIVDSHYYPERPKDNFIPTILAEGHLSVPSHHMGLYYSGGNFQPGPDRSGFTTSLLFQDNPGFSEDYIELLYNRFQGIDTLHVLPRLPGSVDGTGHIDMWMYLVDEDSVIISEFLPGSNSTAIQITENAVPYMESLGFEVFRTPAWNVGWTHYTYTNAFRVNDRIFVPIYGPGNSQYLDEDQAALAAWQAAAGPGVELIPIDCYSIIPAAGAIHCIVMQVPRYTSPEPSVSLLSPIGGELLVCNTERELRWAASDDEEVAALQLAYSTDGGQTFPYVISPRERDTGLFTWTVPLTETPGAVVRVLAGDGDGHADVAYSSTWFEIADRPQHVYDFSTGAGVDKRAWGYRTGNWNELNGTRYPASVTNDIEALVPGAYAAIAAPDASGSDGDPNRYVAPNPSNGYESTHVFELAIDEDPAQILDLELRWEGYGDQCLQMELYVWDHVLGNWGNGLGRAGENMYVANFAGNRDGALVGNIRHDFDRYVGADGRLTLLLYAERPGQESFHDYLSVTVTYE